MVSGWFKEAEIFSTNEQYVKIKLKQTKTNRWSIFFGKDEILVKLRFKGLNLSQFLQLLP